MVIKKQWAVGLLSLTLAVTCLFAGCSARKEVPGSSEIPLLGEASDAVNQETAKEAETESTEKEGIEKENTVAESAAESREGSPEGSTEDSPEAEEPQEIRITVTAAGDVTLGNYLGQGYDNSFDQTYEAVEDKGYFFENVKAIFEEDDFTIVNLEGVLSTWEEAEPGRTFNIKGRPEYVNLIKEASVEGVSMGNNHRMDYGETGTKDTAANLEGVGIPYAFDDRTGIFEVEGIRIGWVSVNEASYGASVERHLKQGITALREQGTELVIACCHWGTEREYFPEEYQTELGRKCIDWGADLVLGHHPHVLQGIDCYKGKYIVYSLGNFCFGANKNPGDKDTMIFQQTFVFSEGELTDELSARVIPCRISSVTHRNDYKPTPLAGAERLQLIDRINGFSSAFGVIIAEDGTLEWHPEMAEGVE